jgi:hypothetical protein
MKRVTQTTYQTTSGRTLITIEPSTPPVAKVLVCSASADDLDELASASAAAAEELRTLAEKSLENQALAAAGVNGRIAT